MLAGQPFDLVKVRLQTMVTKPGQTPPYTGAMDVLRKTLAAEGVSPVVVCCGESQENFRLCSPPDFTKELQHLWQA